LHDDDDDNVERRSLLTFCKLQLQNRSSRVNDEEVKDFLSLAAVIDLVYMATYGIFEHFLTWASADCRLTANASEIFLLSHQLCDAKSIPFACGCCCCCLHEMLLFHGISRAFPLLFFRLGKTIENQRENSHDA